MRIAYGFNRREKDFAGLDIHPGKFFIDNAHTGLQERLDLIMTLRPGAVVVLLSMADLGKGKSQLKAVAAIEATGAVIEVKQVPEKGVAEMGRPVTVEFTDDELPEALQIWANLPAKEALAAIGKRFDKWPDRNRMNYLRRKHSKTS